MLKRNLRTLSLIAAGIAPRATAAPIFQNVASRFGVEKMLILPDSESTNSYYVVPISLVGGAATWEQSETGQALQRQDVGSSARLQMALRPDLTQTEYQAFVNALQTAQAANPAFQILPLRCYDAALTLNGVPSHLISDSAFYPLVTSSGTTGGLVVEPSYTYEIEIDTDQPGTLSPVLQQLGIKGAINLSCLGYTSAPNPGEAPQTVTHAIQINAVIPRTTVE